MEGETPATKHIHVTKDAAIFGERLRDDSLRVEPKSKGIANVTVLLDPAPGTTVEVHPSYLQSADQEPLLIAKECRFLPRVLLVRTGQTVRFRNEDPVGHNFRYCGIRTRPFNRIIPPGKLFRYELSEPERFPVQLVDGIYPWMKAWIIVSGHPYAAVTDEDGEFEIRNLPVGTHRFRIWHERTGFLSELRLGGKDQSLPQGRLVTRIRGGDNPLPQIGVKASLVQNPRSAEASSAGAFFRVTPRSAL